MIRNDARFHLVLLISRYSIKKANAFNAIFEHKDRQRSSNRSEMQEINEFWAQELRSFSRVGAEAALNLEIDRGIDRWLRDFQANVLPFIINSWRP